MEINEIQIPWDGWTLGERLGQGSFGDVYEIHRELTGGTEKSALKIIRLPQSEIELENLQDSGMDDQSIQLCFMDQAEEIKKEYAMMAQLKSCTNVVYCDDLYEEAAADGFSRTLYIKMELLRPLNKAVSVPYDPETLASAVGRDICRALVACEKNSIVHRDIKPQNIFVTEDSVYKLGDFGVARTMEKTMNGTKTGTYHFMAPEVYRGENYGRRVDIYSLGLVLYWLLNNKRGPFLPSEGIITSRCQEEARARRFSGDALPPPQNGSAALKSIVLKACAFKPEDRFQDARAMLDALEEKTLVTDPSEEEFEEEENVEDIDPDATVSAFDNQRKARKKQSDDNDLSGSAFGDQTIRGEADSYEEMRRKIAQQNEAKKRAEEQRIKREQEERRRKLQEENEKRKELEREQKEKQKAQDTNTPPEETGGTGGCCLIILVVLGLLIWAYKATVGSTGLGFFSDFYGFIIFAGGIGLMLFVLFGIFTKFK